MCNAPTAYYIDDEYYKHLVDIINHNIIINPQCYYDKEAIAKLMNKSDKFLINCLCMLYSFQTDDEKSGKHTNEYNGKGFNQFDAYHLSDITVCMLKHRRITYRQLGYVRIRIVKYARQIADIINDSYSLFKEVKKNV